MNVAGQWRTWCGALLCWLVLAGSASSAPHGSARTLHALASGPAKSLGAQPAPSLVIAILLHDTLQPVSANTLQQELDTANARGPAAILLDLSTPGGLAESADTMVRSIQGSRAPVLVFVHEAGTKVEGEGLRVLLAGKAAVMDPGTRLVPLQPLRHGPRSVRARRQTEIEALTRAVAAAVKRRGHDPQSAESLLAQKFAFTPEQARQAGLLDGVTSRDDVGLRALHPDSSAAADALSDSKVEALPLTPRQHMMRALMNPDLTVLLLTLGALLILLEINTPGTIVPGAAGVLLVLLSLYALLQMQLRWQGVLLLLLSVGLLLAETQFTRGSAYGIAAVVALTLGLRLLVRGPVPELEVDWSTSIGAGFGFGSITAGLVLLGVRARRAKIRTGADAMLGWLAVAQTPLNPTGDVLVRGELWRAKLSAGNTFLPAGECVKVQSTDGFTLEVAPMTQYLQETEAAQPV